MKHTYIYDTHTIYVENNELHLINDNQTIVFNIDTFINDLPLIIKLCVKEHKRNNKELYKTLKKPLKKN